MVSKTNPEEIKYYKLVDKCEVLTNFLQDPKCNIKENSIKLTELQGIISDLSELNLKVSMDISKEALNTLIKEIEKLDRLRIKL